MIYLYTENFYWPARLKNGLKKIAGLGPRGPEAVFESLKQGLSENGIEFAVNRPLSGPIGTACVVSGVKTLAWAIAQKKQGNIKKILAGPNIALPKDHGGIIFNPAIDALLAPSPWVVDFCLSFNPGFGPKLKLWASGVPTLPEEQVAKTAKGRGLIYFKNGNKEILNATTQALVKKGIPYALLVYGKHSHSQYMEALRAADFMVYASNSESQGLALHEAWMANVPTLVFGGGHMRNGSYEWKQSSAAPYLTQEAGMFFNSSMDFAPSLENFLVGLPNFKPRAYHLNNFTPKITAKKYLEIYQSL